MIFQRAQKRFRGDFAGIHHHPDGSFFQNGGFCMCFVEFLTAAERPTIELPTHGFSVHVPTVVKYKMGQEKGAGICPMVTTPDQFLPV